MGHQENKMEAKEIKKAIDVLNKINFEFNKKKKKKTWHVKDRFDLKRKKKKIPKNPAKALLKHRRKKYQQYLRNKRKRTKK